MKTKLTALFACLFLINCAGPLAFNDQPNPLDFPNSREPTAKELHSKNVAAITSNPTLQIRTFEN